MPGGCDIFDPFKADERHAALGLTPGDIYWRTRERVQVGGECRYLVAACTPCCDVRGTVLGSHEYGGTMLDAAPDAETGDTILRRLCRCPITGHDPPEMAIFPCELHCELPLVVTQTLYQYGVPYGTLDHRLLRRIGEWHDAPLVTVRGVRCVPVSTRYPGMSYDGQPSGHGDELGVMTIRKESEYTVYYYRLALYTRFLDADVLGDFKVQWSPLDRIVATFVNRTQVIRFDPRPMHPGQPGYPVWRAPPFSVFMGPADGGHNPSVEWYHLTYVFQYASEDAGAPTGWEFV